MAGKTVARVQDKVEQINRDGSVEIDYTNVNGRYRLINLETGKHFGPVCYGRNEFLKFLEGVYLRGEM